MSTALTWVQPPEVTLPRIEAFQREGSKLVHRKPPETPLDEWALQQGLLEALLRLLWGPETTVVRKVEENHRQQQRLWRDQFRRIDKTPPAQRENTKMQWEMQMQTMPLSTALAQSSELAVREAAQQDPVTGAIVGPDWEVFLSKTRQYHQEKSTEVMDDALRAHVSGMSSEERRQVLHELFTLDLPLSGDVEKSLEEEQAEADGVKVRVFDEMLATLTARDLVLTVDSAKIAPMSRIENQKLLFTPPWDKEAAVLETSPQKLNVGAPAAGWIGHLAGRLGNWADERMGVPLFSGIRRLMVHWNGLYHDWRVERWYLNVMAGGTAHLRDEPSLELVAQSHITALQRKTASQLFGLACIINAAHPILTSLVSLLIDAVYGLCRRVQGTRGGTTRQRHLRRLEETLSRELAKRGLLLVVEGSVFLACVYAQADLYTLMSDWTVFSGEPGNYTAVAMHDLNLTFAGPLGVLGEHLELNWPFRAASQIALLLAYPFLALSWRFGRALLRKAGSVVGTRRTLPSVPKLLENLTRIGLAGMVAKEFSTVSIPLSAPTTGDSIALQSRGATEGRNTTEACRDPATIDLSEWKQNQDTLSLRQDLHKGLHVSRFQLQPELLPRESGRLILDTACAGGSETYTWVLSPTDYLGTGEWGTTRWESAGEFVVLALTTAIVGEVVGVGTDAAKQGVRAVLESAFNSSPKEWIEWGWKLVPAGTLAVPLSLFSSLLPVAQQFVAPATANAGSTVASTAAMAVAETAMSPFAEMAKFQSERLVGRQLIGRTMANTTLRTRSGIITTLAMESFLGSWAAGTLALGFRFLMDTYRLVRLGFSKTPETLWKTLEDVLDQLQELRQPGMLRPENDGKRREMERALLERVWYMGRLAYDTLDPTAAEGFVSTLRSILREELRTGGLIHMEPLLLNRLRKNAEVPKDLVETLNWTPFYFQGTKRLRWRGTAAIVCLSDTPPGPTSARGPRVTSSRVTSESTDCKTQSDRAAKERTASLKAESQNLLQRHKEAEAQEERKRLQTEQTSQHGRMQQLAQIVPDPNQSSPVRTLSRLSDFDQQVWIRMAETQHAKRRLTTNKERLHLWNVVSYPTWSEALVQQRELLSVRNKLFLIVHALSVLGLVDPSGTEKTPGTWLNVVCVLVHPALTRAAIETQKDLSQRLLRLAGEVDGLTEAQGIFRRCCAILPDPFVMKSMFSLVDPSVLQATENAEDVTYFRRLHEYSKYYYSDDSSQTAVKEPKSGEVMAFISEKDPYGRLRRFMDRYILL